MSANLRNSPIESAQAVSGFLLGSFHPGMLYIAHLPALDEDARGQFRGWLAAACNAENIPQSAGTPASPESQNAGQATAELLFDCTAFLLDQAALPVCERGRLLRLERGGRARLYFPTAMRCAKSHDRALRWLLGALHKMQAGIRPDRSGFMEVLAALRASAYPRSNTPRFIRAAHRLGMPFFELPGNVVQYGAGVTSQWLESTFTEDSSVISSTLSRNKRWTSSLLSRAGIPVAAQVGVADEAAALAAADRLGYPVVIKPADLDGGLGVAAGLDTPQEVREAFARAKRFDTPILLEKHVFGRDYRLQVFNGKLLWAIERIPGGVIGDGTLTIAQLVDGLNADPRRGKAGSAALKHIELDAEALQMIAKAGLSVDSVPSPGQYVALRRIANVATGGLPVAVNEKVHPDNAELAIRAAAALRLDLAGIDLLIPDITLPWHESGGVVCEVNGQPQLGSTTGPHLYGEVLKALVPGNGRIPCALIVGKVPGHVTERFESALITAGCSAGIHDARGARIAGRTIAHGKLTPFAAGQIFVGDRSVDAMLLTVDDLSVLRTGLPVPRVDLILLHPATLSESGRHPRDAVDQMVSMLLPACDGTILSIGDDTPSPPTTQAHWLAFAELDDHVLDIGLTRFVDLKSHSGN